MKKKILALIPLSIFLIFNALAQNSTRGTVLESLTVESKILGRAVNYSVYLPADYFSAQRRYPVVYLLHGLYGSEKDWLQNGEANRTADKMMASGEIPDMIIVMPDGKNDWYMNSYDGKTLYEDFFIKEFIPFIDSAYQTRAEKAYRALSGLSMGGYGSTLFSLKYPDKFAACAALSAAVRTDEEMVTTPKDRYEAIFGQLYGRNLPEKERLTDSWRKNSVLELFNKASVENLNKIQWYFDCGDDDYLYKGNAALHVAFFDKKIPHEFRMRDGGHTWTYWRDNLGFALKFIGDVFHRK